MKTLFVVAGLFFSLMIHAQKTPKTQEEMEAFLKDIQRKADSMQNVAKKKGINTNTNKNTFPPGGSGKQTTVQKDKESKIENLPPPDSAMIRSLPKKNLTAAELTNYLNDLHLQLTKRFPADAVASAKAIATKLGNQPSKLEAAALHGWQNGADEEALLLITKAAASGGDGLVLTNAGGMLDMYGLPEKAIPVLRTIVSHNSGNVIALNNLGQAYTALGMRDSAMIYLSRCISLSSHHPEANNTAGHIELKKGNKSKAQAYFENSLRGSFNLGAYTGLATIFKDDKSKLKIAHLIKPKVKTPEYFNQFKYSKFPRQCYNVFEAATVSEEFKVYKQMLSKETRKYDLLGKEAEKQMGKDWAEKMNKKTMDAVMKGESYMKPFQVLGAVMVAEAGLGIVNDMADLHKFNTENRAQYEQLGKEYKEAIEQMRKSESHSCAAENELKNKYLEKFALLNKEWQSRNLLVLNKYIDDQLYWCYFSASDLDDYRHSFYNQVYDYLYKVNYLAQVNILEPCEETEPGEVEQPQREDLPEFDCPVDVEFSFIVGKVTMNCEKFSFKAGEGIIFKYEKKFKGHRQTTISIGAGAGVDATWKAGPIKAGFEAGMDMSVYLTFDKAGNWTDGGMTYGASRGAGVDFSAGERIKIKKGLGYVGENIGWRFGINSGVSFDTPDLPWMKDKPETQINRNVRIYQE